MNTYPGCLFSDGSRAHQLGVTPWFFLFERLVRLDAEDVPYNLRQVRYLLFGMRILAAKRLLNGYSTKSMYDLGTLILRHIVGNMPVSLYQYAFTMVATGQCVTAMRLFQQAIIMEHLPSLAHMALMLWRGREGVPPDRNKAFELANEGASRNCHNCKGVLAVFLRFGYGTQQDALRSLELAQESVSKESGFGYLALGLIHQFSSQGVDRDVAKSSRLFKKAAKKGIIDAKHHLACMCTEQGVRKNHVKALHLWQESASQGHPDALYEIAVCHEEGRGVPKNIGKAIKWYKRAGAAGHDYAPHALRRLNGA
jgi:TPR repeat protein